MSFGYGVGDFIVVGQLCWKVYKKCKDSPGSYADLSSEVGGLHNVIKETEELLSQQGLTTKQTARVTTCRQGCEDVLGDLDALLVKYQGLGTKSQRTFDRLGFGIQDVSGIRLRLISNVSILDAFNNASSHARLERKLNLLMVEIRAGKREGSVVSTCTFDSAARNGQEIWDALRRELEDIGISPGIINEKRQFIIAWFQEAIAMGQLDEAAPPNANDGAVSFYEPNDSAGTSDCDDLLEREDRSVVLKPYNTKGGKLKESIPKAQTNAWLDLESQDKILGTELSQSRDTKFLEAAIAGDVPVLKRLLREGVHIKVRVPSHEIATAFHLAAAHGRDEAVRWLLLKGADIHTRNSRRGTALHRAARKGHEKIVRLLLENGAQSDWKTTLGYTALTFAAKAGHLAVVRVLLDMGVDLESKTFSGNTALNAAASEGHVAVVRLLLEKGADIESENSYGNTALNQMAIYNQEAVMRLLLDMGAKVNIKNKQGETALSYAICNRNKATIKILRGAGAQR